MTFIGQSADDWKRGMEHTLGNLDLDGAIALALQPTTYSWGFDQNLVTASIINSRFCTFPESYANAFAKASKLVKVSPDDTLNDTDTACLKRQRGPLQRTTRVLDVFSKPSCTYVHFLPTVRLAQLQNAYDGIARNYPGYVESGELLRLSEDINARVDKV